MKKFTWYIVFAVAMWSGILLQAEPVVVKSPDERVQVQFEVKEDALFYSLDIRDKPLVASSTLEILAGAKMEMVSHSVKENDTSWTPVYGPFRSIRDHHRELTLSLTVNGTPVTLVCRAFDTGIGMRFVLPQALMGEKIDFFSAFNVVEDAAYFTPEGERGVAGPVARGELKRLASPVVIQQSDGRAVALLESDLFSAVGFNKMGIRIGSAGEIIASNPVDSDGPGKLTPWRVILVGENLGELMVNTVALNLAAPCKLGDTSWIKPGKGLWDWRIHGYDNGEFVYGVDTRSYLRLIDFCAEQGIELLTIDDHWFTSAKGGNMVVAPEVDIEKVMAHAKAKGVLIMLYYDRMKGNFGDDTLFSHYSDLGAAGMKYGFMGGDVEFTRSAITAAAENKLVINFHDNPVPMSGVERTMPNLITREYCHAQQDGRRAFTPETFIKMAMVNALVGPLDMANGNFGIKSINAGERKKGPKKKNSYISTVISEVARTLVITTGLITLPDAPEEYLKKADLFEFLQKMPALWDDSVVLASKIGEYVAVARRTGDAWFVGSVNDQSERKLDLVLDFLEPGVRYQATLYQDAEDAHGVTNPEAYEIKSTTVKKGDVVTARMAVGGGHAMILRPVN